jgi:two-component system, OmpR family, sensor kinase
MTSLRKQLLLWLVPVFGAVALFSVLCTYFMYGYMVSWFMDSQLQVLADSHAVATDEAPALRPLTEHAVQKGNPIVQIWNRDGRLMTSSYPDVTVSRQSGDGFHDVRVGEQGWRVYSVHSPDRTVQSVQSLEFRAHTINKQALAAGLPIVALIPISAAILWFVLTMALHRLKLVANAAAAQDERSVGELPPEHVPDEIRPLVVAVNRLLMRLRDAFVSQRRFVQDAAHELRTPITAMSLQLENLKYCETCAADPEAVAQAHQFDAGLKRTKRLVEQLLRLARQEAPQKQDAAASIDLEEFLRTLIGDVMPLADHRNIDLGLSVDVAATVLANQDELRSLLHNLLDNALRYTPTTGVVDVRVHGENGAVVVEVLDTGPGIPTDVLPRVFDRFFRIEGTDTEGSGLGLAIAKNAAERNRIELQLVNRQDRSGLIARVTFAAAAVVQHIERLPETPVHRLAASG